MRYQYQLLAYFKVMQEKIISNGYGIKGKIKNGSKEINMPTLLARTFK